MTCIVGLKYNKKVYIGGDSLGSDTSFSKTVRLDKKVFTVGEMSFGFTTSFRMGQLLEYVLDAPERPEGISDMKYLIAHWVPAVIECFSEHGYKGTRDSEDHAEEAVGGTFLLGYRGVLYIVDSDFQIGIPAEQYAAVGCGSDLALGALYAAKKAGIKAPEELVITALEASEKFSGGVERPFNIVSST